MAEIADLYWTFKLLHDNDRRAELEQVRREGGFTPSLDAMAEAVKAELFDQVVYQGSLSVMRQEQLGKSVHRPGRGLDQRPP